jgi:hypothetical protein
VGLGLRLILGEGSNAERLALRSSRVRGSKPEMEGGFGERRLWRLKVELELSY